MNYIERTLERKFLHMSSFFKAVLVTGARQVGKTTMLKHLAEGQSRTYVSMDNAMARTLAQTDPVLFFQTYKPPIIIDEVQKAPQLFEQIKIICDESEEKGLFWLTGSQQFNMMRNVRETLAGRIGILELYGLSKNEIEGIKFSDDLDFSLPCLLERQKQVKKNDIVDVFEHIWRGGMPQVVDADAEQRQEYYNSYVDTYLMRDVAEAGGITDTVRFGKFLTACAALTAEQINYKTLAEAAEISQPTAREWVRVLHGLGVIYLLQPFSNNQLKRLTKAPKLYFCDTGLCAWLSMWLTRDTLMTGAVSGHYFENYVVMELVKHYAYAKSKANLNYYRDSNAKEIDVFVEENNLIHPLEIKKSANPDRREVKKYALVDKTSLERGCGGIICMCQEVIPIDDKNCFIPCSLI
ncbi:ATP-binding protein [Ihubacter massiliensis]|uniref:ATP-binding protein n=1 Tax=Hominibacterium faecale TaxID=2839743 RepID=A0A9J6QRH1_9FIRM|nr:MULTISPECIES: ATP-binding protein [Eubacteriales Family XIII. Incertae Sedis]MCO7122629.1 ATP-binding protein [Ihubacter massiliensis]MCU7376903.1 ATP-binding protein [Hominibacterium faecale]MCU7379452.1 ATP-binding protein [Hominibacterium faecale]